MRRLAVLIPVAILVAVLFHDGTMAAAHIGHANGTSMAAAQLMGSHRHDSGQHQATMTATGHGGAPAPEPGTILEPNQDEPAGPSCAPVRSGTPATGTGIPAVAGDASPALPGPSHVSDRHPVPPSDTPPTTPPDVRRALLQVYRV
ncbi:MAG: hypothetical protein WBA46_04005 [Thermomicrobiales bacterium]